MKLRYLIAGIFTIGIIGVGSAQDVASGRQYEATTTETSSVQYNLQKNADIQTLRMKEALGLDEEQFYEVREINYAYADDIYRASAECTNSDLEGELRSIEKARESRLKQALTHKQFKAFKQLKDANGWNYENFRIDCLSPETSYNNNSNFNTTTESDYVVNGNGAFQRVRPEYANMPLPYPGDVSLNNGCTLSSKNAPSSSDNVYIYTEGTDKEELKVNGDKIKDKNNKEKFKGKGEKDKVKVVGSKKNPVVKTKEKE